MDYYVFNTEFGKEPEKFGLIVVHWPDNEFLQLNGSCLGRLLGLHRTGNFGDEKITIKQGDDIKGFLIRADIYEGENK